MPKHRPLRKPERYIFLYNWIKTFNGNGDLRLSDFERIGLNRSHARYWLQQMRRAGMIEPVKRYARGIVLRPASKWSAEMRRAYKQINELQKEMK